MHQRENDSGRFAPINAPWPEYYGGVLAELPFWPLQDTVAWAGAEAVATGDGGTARPRRGYFRAIAALLPLGRHGVARAGWRG